MGGAPQTHLAGTGGGWIYSSTQPKKGAVLPRAEKSAHPEAACTKLALYLAAPAMGLEYTRTYDRYKSALVSTIPVLSCGRVYAAASGPLRARLRRAPLEGSGMKP